MNQIIDFNLGEFESSIRSKYLLMGDSRKGLISSKLSFSYLNLNQY